MNQVVKFVKEHLPEFAKRFDAYEEKFIKDNGVSWAGSKGDPMRELQFSCWNFDEALKVYTNKIVNNDGNL